MLKNKICVTISYYACSAAHCAVPTDTSFCVLLALEPDPKSPKSKRNPLAESTNICDPLSNGSSFGFQRFWVRLQSKQNTKRCVGRNRTMCCRASTVGNGHSHFIFQYFCQKSSGACEEISQEKQGIWGHLLNPACLCGC